MRIQITVDDALGHELQAKAEELGFSVSAYARHLLKKSLGKAKPNKIDIALEEIKNGDVEHLTLEQFKQQLEDLKK